MHEHNLRSIKINRIFLQMRYILKLSKPCQGTYGLQRKTILNRIKVKITIRVLFIYFCNSKHVFSSQWLLLMKKKYFTFLKRKHVWKTYRVGMSLLKLAIHTALRRINMKNIDWSAHALIKCL